AHGVHLLRVHVSGREGVRARPGGSGGLAHGGLLAVERECQAGNDEGQEKYRQDALSAASETGDFALADVERLGSAEFRPLRTCRVCRPGSTGMSMVSFSSTDPARLPSTMASYVPRRTSTPMVLCVSFSVADIADLLWFS